MVTVVSATRFPTHARDSRSWGQRPWCASLEPRLHDEGAPTHHRGEQCGAEDCDSKTYARWDWLRIDCGGIGRRRRERDLAHCITPRLRAAALSGGRWDISTTQGR